MSRGMTIDHRMTDVERHEIGQIICGNVQHTTDEMLERIDAVLARRASPSKFPSDEDIAWDLRHVDQRPDQADAYLAGVAGNRSEILGAGCAPLTGGVDSYGTQANGLGGAPNTIDSLLRQALEAAKGHLLNAAIDLETGRTKPIVLATIRDCIQMVDAALARSRE